MLFPVRRMIPAILGIACLATAGRTEYRAEHYAPWLDDLRDRLAVLHAALVSPSTTLEVERKAALEKSLAALDLPSASMQEDLALLVRALTPLWPVYRDDPAMELLAQYEMNLYWERMEERQTELDRVYPPPSGSELERYLKGKRLLGSWYQIQRKTRIRATDSIFRQVRPWSWGSAARRLLKSARFLDKAADLLGMNHEYTLVVGTVSATLDGVPYTWRIATAHRLLTPIFLLLDEPAHNYIQWKAYAIDPYTALGPMNLFDPHLGDVYPKPVEDSRAEPGVAIWYNPRFLGSVHPDEYGYYPDPNGTYMRPEDVPREIVLEAYDEAAGTASGTFRMTLFLSGGLSPAVFEGRFEITSGLRTYME